MGTGMALNQTIEFPNAGIHIDGLSKGFSVFGFNIAFYGVIIGLGIITGFFAAQWQAKRTGQDKELYLDLALFAVPLSIVGARVYYIVFSWEEFRTNLWEIFNLRSGGLAIYGGVIAAALTAFVFAKIKKQSFGLIADTGCIGLITGQIIGRWGNFFNREAFGDYTNNLFAMRLPVEDVAYSSITEKMLQQAEAGGYTRFIQVHPTFLYESLWNVAVLVLLLLFSKHKRFDGELFLFYLVGYGLGRLWMEGLRTDQLRLWGSDIAVSQLLSLVFIALAVILWIFLRRKSVKHKTG